MLQAALFPIPGRAGAVPDPIPGRFGSVPDPFIPGPFIPRDAAGSPFPIPVRTGDVSVPILVRVGVPRRVSPRPPGHSSECSPRSPPGSDSGVCKDKTPAELQEFHPGSFSFGDKTWKFPAHSAICCNQNSGFAAAATFRGQNPKIKAVFFFSCKLGSGRAETLPMYNPVKSYPRRALFLADFRCCCSSGLLFLNLPGAAAAEREGERERERGCLNYCGENKSGGNFIANRRLSPAPAIPESSLPMRMTLLISRPREQDEHPDTFYLFYFFIGMGRGIAGLGMCRDPDR